MRNLVLLNKGRFKPSGKSDPELELELELYTSVFDTISDSITCVLGASDVGIVEVVQYMKDGTANVLASFHLETYKDKLLSFAHFADVCQLVFTFQQGDIITATYDPETYDPTKTTVQIMGSIDLGIEAADWSYDEETLALVTAERNVVLLSRQFEPIAEYKLEKEDLNISKHVNVGWGKKETQFRGKGARDMEREALESLKASGLVGNELRDPTMPYAVDSGSVTEMDSGETSISWRGDCEYFVVSTVEDVDVDGITLKRRALRVFSRNGQIDSASEPVDGLESQISWKPQGSLIASIQRKIHIPGEESLDLVFFERNGLRHGEFDTRLPLDEKINTLCWNCNSEVLAIVLYDKIQLWTTKNYHWYLKLEVHAENITFAKWHPEKDFTLMFGNDDFVNVVDFAYKMTVGPTLEPFDNGTVLVIDGNIVNITPLGVANVPPPIYYREFITPSNVIDAAVSLSNELYAALNKDELVVAGVPSLEDMKKGSHPSLIFRLPKTDFATEYDELRQVSFINDNIIGILLDSDGMSRIAMIDLQDIQQPIVLNVIETFEKIVLLRTQYDYNYLVYQARDGRVVQMDAEGQMLEVAKFPQLVRDFRVKRVESSPESFDDNWNTESSKLIAFGISAGGKLFANETQLATAVTSLEITDSFLLFTTAQHNLQFVHLNTTDFEPLPMVEEGVSDERVRSIERGSILVTAMPSKSSVVLQAARGNLETICPRIMVLSVVRKDILAKRYRDAFTICRTHRIHLDILHDYAPDLFFENLNFFIEDIKKGEYLDLFISCLCEEDVTKTKYKDTIRSTMAEKFEVAPPPLTEMEQYMKKKMFDPSKSKVNKICNAILDVLLNNAEYKKTYIQSIITAYACQNPPRLRDALLLISSLGSEDEKEAMLTYLCFLQDVNVLYKVALSLYDIKLTLAIAQKSQMDPKEYLPFLQELYDQDSLVRMYMIDDHLKNYEGALNHLVEMEQSNLDLSDKIVHYIERHELYKFALNIFRYDPIKQNTVYHAFAKYLYSKQEYADSAIIFEMLGEFKEAMNTYTVAKKWCEALAIAESKFSNEIPEIAEQLVSSLSFEHRYTEAAKIELNYLKNVKEATALYCKSYFYEEAALIATSKKLPELIEEVIEPALGEGFGVIAELLADCKSQVNSQLKRLRELRQKKKDDPYAFYGQETMQADDVSIAPSETSTKESFFTRYTGKTGGTAKTGASRKTAKNKRREERKRARGKKGTIYEEEYLVKSVGRLIERMDQTRPDALKLIEALLRFNKREQAYQIQRSFVDLVTLLKENVVEIYSISEKDRERIDENGQIYYLPEIPLPTIADFPKTQVIDF